MHAITGTITHADFGFGRTSATLGLLLTISDGGFGVDIFEEDRARIAKILTEAGVVAISQLVGRKASAKFANNDSLVGWHLD